MKLSADNFLDGYGNVVVESRFCGVFLFRSMDNVLGLISGLFSTRLIEKHRRCRTIENGRFYHQIFGSEKGAFLTYKYVS